MGNRLLLADDSITIQKVVGIIFANEDYDLTVVDNGAAALEKAREAVPDVMLVDALMPEKNGYEVCQEVRADASLQHVPLLLMTGAFEPFDEEKAHRCGADDFISKPFESQQLVDKVKQLIELGRQRFTSAAPQAEETAAAEPESMFIPIPTAPWEAPADEAASTFEPLPEMFGTLLEPTESAGPIDIQASTVSSEEFAVEVVEASPSDDPWGVFELSATDEEPIASAAEPVDMSFQAEESEPAFQPDAELPRFEDAIEPPTAFVPDQPEPKWAPVEEETFTFQEEDIPQQGDMDSFAVGLNEPQPAAAMVEPDSFAEAGEFAQSVPVESAAFYEHAVEPAESAPAALGEAQLKAILSQLSKETIEKIVWEVVPDLAETLIREEIRKIKAGAAE